MVSHKKTLIGSNSGEPHVPIDVASSQSLLTRRPNDASPPVLTLTLMTSHHNRTHTGSVKHRVNNYRASYFNTPVGATSQPGESTISNKSARTLRKIQINVEGLSHEKCQYLARLRRENDIDVAVLQETHVKEASSPRRYTVHMTWQTQRTTRSMALPLMCEKTSMRDQWS